MRNLTSDAERQVYPSDFPFPDEYYRVVVLFSGGIDSSGCLALFLNQRYLVHPLFCDYGQPAAGKEYDAATLICHHYSLPLHSIKSEGFGIPTEGFIQGRNAFLLNCALMSFPWESGLVSLGIHAGSSYPDCTPLFVETMQMQYDLYKDGRVKITAPFLNLNKADIWQYCHQQKVPLNLTYSCERGTTPPCGKCLSCLDLEGLYACSQ